MSDTDNTLPAPANRSDMPEDLLNKSPQELIDYWANRAAMHQAEIDRLKSFIPLVTSFDTENPEMNAARYDGYLDGVQVGMDAQRAEDDKTIRSLEGDLEMSNESIRLSRENLKQVGITAAFFDDCAGLAAKEILGQRETIVALAEALNISNQYFEVVVDTGILPSMKVHNAIKIQSIKNRKALSDNAPRIAQAQEYLVGGKCECCMQIKRPCDCEIQQAEANHIADAGKKVGEG